jgi:3-oxoacyl-[acyl-carrier protein] reductase
MELNLTAQVRTLDAVLPPMRSGASIVFVTSHLAHFYGRKPVHGGYEPISVSKKAGRMPCVRGCRSSKHAVFSSQSSAAT